MYSLNYDINTDFRSHPKFLLLFLNTNRSVTQNVKNLPCVIVYCSPFCETFLVAPPLVILTQRTLVLIISFFLWKLFFVEVSTHCPGLVFLMIYLFSTIVKKSKIKRPRANGNWGKREILNEYGLQQFQIRIETLIRKDLLNPEYENS